MKDLPPQSEESQKKQTTYHSDTIIEATDDAIREHPINPSHGLRSHIDWHDHWIAVDAQGMVWGLFSSYEAYRQAIENALAKGARGKSQEYHTRIEGMTASAYIMDYMVTGDE